MTEKQYGGATGRGSKSTKINNKTNTSPEKISASSKISPRRLEGGEEKKSSKLSYQDKILKAGKIASEVREYIKSIIKKNMLLLDIAEKIENKIIELDGKPAFPVNLSINEIAAHYTPSYDDKTLSHGLLKVDFGVHIDGWCSDQSFSIDLENSDENKKLIQASKDALDNAIKLISRKIEKKESKAVEF